MKLKIRKGLKLSIKGAISDTTHIDGSRPMKLCAITPDDFRGFTPKMAVKEGDEVEAGAPVMYDKKQPDVKLVSPVNGRIKTIVRGERRKIERVEIEPAVIGDKAGKALTTDDSNPIGLLAASGLLAMIHRRPFDIVPSLDDKVRDIFVVALDPAPLAAPAYATATEIFSKDDYCAAAALLNKITDGIVYFCHDSNWKLGDIDGCRDIEVAGPYPAGNAGVIIDNIAPINKGEVVWTLDAATMARIGYLVRTGKGCFDTVVAVTGPEVKNPSLVKTIIGADIKSIVEGNLCDTNSHLRIISGNVFTGTAVDIDNGFLHAPYRQITVIDEGDDTDEFMGWASFAPSKMSENPTFPGHFLKRFFKPDARLHGGRRAMIMSGQYDKVTPMDILPEYLIKAILSHNIEDMERLGIYEVAPEDFAAAEYADTSKLPLQKIVADGIDFFRKETE